MLKIGYDFRAIASKHKSGVEKYILQVAELVPPEMPDTQFYFFVNASANRGEYSKYIQKNVKILRIPVSGEKKFWIIVKILTKMLGIDLFHFPLGIMPVSLPCKTIINIHDLTYEMHPEFYEDWEVSLQRRMVPLAAKDCNKVLTISESTKDDIIRFYGIASSKIDVIYPVIMDDLKPDGMSPNKTEPYFVAIGNIQPRKNFPKIAESLKFLSQNIKLYIVGKTQDEEEQKAIQRIVEKNKLQRRVVITGYLPSKALEELLNHAVGLVFVSIYEGFGYPIVEAFKRGLPVITSIGSSMEEIAGDAAIIVNPESAEDIARAMEKLLKSDVIRKGYVRKGALRLKELSGERFGKKIANVYEQVLREGTR